MCIKFLFSHAYVTLTEGQDHWYWCQNLKFNDEAYEKKYF